MSRLMSLSGIVLAVAGLLLIVLAVVSPGVMQVYGVTPEAGAILLVGGVLAFGLGGVISAIGHIGVETVEPVAKAEKPVLPPEAKAPAAGGFGRKGAEPAAGPVVAAAGPKSTAPSVAETISALEQAKSDIKTALGGMEDVTGGSGDLTPVPDALQSKAEAAAPSEEAAPAEAEEGDLYVVEEKIIRGRPSRILSDDTVEAETDEGWMRFENLEHLNEYLDSVEEGQS
jgi:hypothetical protein